MPTLRPTLLVAMATVFLVVSCGGDAQASDPAGIAAAGGTAGDHPPGDLPEDVCALLSSTLAAQVLGSTEAPMTPGDPADTAAGLVSCAYGSITDVSGGLTVQVASPDAVDPFAPLIPEGTRQEPLTDPPGAVRHEIGLVPGGSGIGSTVRFDHDGRRVAVSVAGVDADDVDTDALDRAAATVYAQLDRP